MAIQPTMIIRLSDSVLLLALACSIAPPAAGQWRLEEEWRVGGAPDGPHSFDYNFALAPLPSGGFVHFDYKSEQLHFLDARGRPVRTVGRTGSGPGETRLANGLAVAPDGRVVVNDRANGRFTVFGSNGEFQGVARSPVPRGSMGGRWTALFLRDGRLIETVALVPPLPDRETRIQIWSADLSVVDSSIGRRCDPQSGAPSGVVALRRANGQLIQYVAVPFARPDVAVAYDPAGFEWRAQNPGSNRLVRRRVGECAVVSSIVLGGDRVATGSAERAHIETRMAAAARQFGVPVPTPAIPDHYPWFKGIYVDAESNLWVERDAPGFKRRVEVYSATGVQLGALAGGFPANLRTDTLFITTDHVYGLVVDTDGVSHLAAFRIVRP